MTGRGQPGVNTSVCTRAGFAVAALVAAIFGQVGTVGASGPIRPIPRVAPRPVERWIIDYSQTYSDQENDETCLLSQAATQLPWRLECVARPPVPPHTLLLTPQNLQFYPGGALGASWTDTSTGLPIANGVIGWRLP